jgi:hypothetical protein
MGKVHPSVVTLAAAHYIGRSSRELAPACGWTPERSPKKVGGDTPDRIAEYREQVGPPLLAPAS